MGINTHLIDCMGFMKGKADGFYDLAVVDPPYSIGASFDNRFGKLMNKAATNRKNYLKKEWDDKLPTEDYFIELIRISKNQIIWGVNYYKHIDLTGGRIFWYKDVADAYTASKGELAFKSFGHDIDYFKYTWSGMRQEDMKNKQQRIHPTEKPIALYKWLLKNYAKPNDKIFDSHGGSMSIAIACYDLNFDLDICELDPDYYRDGVSRLRTHIKKCEEIKAMGFARTEVSKINPTLF